MPNQPRSTRRYRARLASCVYFFALRLSCATRFHPANALATDALHCTGLRDLGPPPSTPLTEDSADKTRRIRPDEDEDTDADIGMGIRATSDLC